MSPTRPQCASLSPGGSMVTLFTKDPGRLRRPFFRRVLRLLYFPQRPPVLTSKITSFYAPIVDILDGTDNVSGTPSNFILPVPGVLPTSSQTKKDNHQEKCDPGFYLSGESGSCISCIDGKEYTSHQNQLPSCRLCAVCKSDEEEVAPCTTIQNRKCQCKKGTFREENSPEFCKNCSSRSDRICGNQTSGNTSSPGKPETTSTGPPAAPSASSGSAQSSGSKCVVPVVLSVCVALLLLLGLIITLALWYRKHLSDCPAVFKWVNRFPFRFIYHSSESGAVDNTYNERQNLRELQSVKVSEQEQEGQELAERAGDTSSSVGLSRS
ncbi:tumor necrosis factor receptor superfamily member 10D-like [Erinaceus europaeus]|uniref:Tumor necrosis factor receptor superfamily member 10D-like n=1 Tax=Erinaceus europaeus TaxID=9365 RepID=A0ABM3WEY2_ERIEU|nr:tumor necrosis factor receptor superfamily member 10D-like [Erinaceus europaeus]